MGPEGAGAQGHPVCLGATPAHSLRTGNRFVASSKQGSIADLDKAEGRGAEVPLGRARCGTRPWHTATPGLTCVCTPGGRCLASHTRGRGVCKCTYTRVMCSQCCVVWASAGSL